MIPGPVQTMLVALSALGGAGLLVIALSLLVQTRRHRRLRTEGLAREAAWLATPLPPGRELPHVVIQVPVYNEGRVVERALEQALAQEWPGDRLHVQILDDSTDGTTEVARAAAASARERGFDVQVLHRTERSEFKAGALRAGMAATPHGYFAIFDVDHVYAPAFIRHCMNVLLQRDEVAFVQGSLGLFNRDRNWLTRAQGVLLDLEHGMMQALEGWTGGEVKFNGTGGVWRRAAVEDAGEWRGTSLVEDLELTCRVRDRGWQSAYLTSVVSRGEAAARLGDWADQVDRWMAGNVEVLVRRAGRSRGGDPGGVSFLLATMPPVLVALAALVAAVALVGAPDWRPIVVGGSAVVAALTVGGLALASWAGAGIRPPRPSPLRHLLDLVPLPALLAYMGWCGLWAIPGSVAGRRRTFVRTPKREVPAGGPGGRP